MAMSAYRNYTNNVSAMKKNLEKLSSGYKINRAGDDAAGLAISEKMRAQITGLEVAQKNAKDGISLVQTAEGALTEVHDMLNRMYTLAEQSANGTYDDGVDRAQLQKELASLRTEIDRIADSSNFNGINLLDGSLGSGGTASVNTDDIQWTNATMTAVRDATVEKKASKGKFELDLSQARWTSTGASSTVKFTFAQGTEVTVTFAAATGAVVTGAQVATAYMDSIKANNNLVTVDGKQFRVTNDAGKLTFIGTDTSSLKGATPTTVKIDGTGIVKVYDDEATAGNQGWSQGWTQIEEPSSATGKILAQASVNFTTNEVKDGSAVKIGDQVYIFAVGKDSAFKNVNNVIDLTDKSADSADLVKAAVNRLSGVANTNGSVYVEVASNGTSILLTEKDGGLDRDVYDVIGVSTGAKNDAKWINSNNETLVQLGSATAPVDLNSKSVNGLRLQIGDTADDWNQLKVSINDCHASKIGIGEIDIGTQDGATAAMKAIKGAINYVSDVRGTLGATQNRLEHTINNLGVMQENIQDAESTIRDVDVAEEMMAYTKNNILIQSAQAMLAQANQIPQGVLQLLG